MTALPPSVEKTVASEIAKGPQVQVNRKNQTARWETNQEFATRIALLQAEQDARICEARVNPKAGTVFGPQITDEDRESIACARAIRANAAALQTTPEQEKYRKQGVTMQVTQEMIDRFLRWPLPSDFHPDAGISFNPEFNVEWNAKQGKPPQRHEPIGTNLLTAEQARAMLEFVLASGPHAQQERRRAAGWCPACKGSGEGPIVHYMVGEQECDRPSDCPMCNGTGDRRQPPEAARVTREQIEEWRKYVEENTILYVGMVTRAEVVAICDLALRALERDERRERGE